MVSRRTPRNMVTLAIAAIASLGLLAGCTAEPPQDAPTPPPTSATVGIVGELTSFNPGTPHGDTPANRAVAQILDESFAYVDDELQVAANTGFGQIERMSNDPLTVVYQLHQNRMWSDGRTVTLDDLLFGWAVNSGWFDDATYDAQGNVVSGTRYFHTAQEPPVSLREGSRPVTDRRQRTLTLEYDEPFADWNRQWLLDRPLHVVAERAGYSEAKIIETIRNAPRGNPQAPAEPDPVLLAVGKAWESTFDIDPAAPDLTVAVSNGPYMVESWHDDQLELTRNPDYHGENRPALDRLSLRFFPDADAQREAVRAGVVDIANLGSLSAATIGRLEATGVTVLKGPRPAALGLVFVDEDERMDDELRQALMFSIDRARLVEESVKRTNPDAVPLRSFLSTPAAGDAYDEVTTGNGAPGDGADLGRARSLVADRAAQVRIRYEPTDAIASDLFSEIARMAGEVGIEVRPAGDDDAADAEIVEWDESGSLYESAKDRITGGAGGLAAAKALSQMRRDTDPEHVVEVAREIDRALFENLYGMPLVEKTGVVAHTSRVRDVVYTASPWGTPSEFWHWLPNR